MGQEIKSTTLKLYLLTAKLVFLLDFFKLNHPHLRSQHDGPGAIMHLKLGKNVLDVNFDRVFGNVQLGGDFLISQTSRDVSQNFQFPRT